ncbi:uncharacterized protein LOC117114363 isoform X2 [Anneissia japonica]|uniref:uncharacterized protein LOC117114363 isoform X2 n=1 Tax=Anneissia japonica TaxID=1529436 RepID=UPI001425ABD3|nr:uncharacterized protein LOC117114363 isoform X2 [Anneissia japonica]
MHFERNEESIATPNITKRTCRFKMAYIRVGVCLAFVITIVSLPVVFSGSTCNASKNIRLDNNMTRDVVILKAIVKKVKFTSITIRVQKQFTTKQLEESSINILTPETLFDVCGSEIETDKAYVFFLVPINGTNSKFELSENVYQASKVILRQVRKIAVQLEATTTAAATTSIIGTTVGIETTSMPGPGNSMVELCDENNTLTCYYGGTCYQIGGAAPHCFCPVGRAGAQCELIDYSTLTFESTSTNRDLLKQIGSNG